MKRKQLADIDIEQVLGLIVHSYNNHLASINGFSELATLHTTETQVEKLLNNVIHSGEKASHFSKTILASISRLQLELEVVTISQLMQNLKSLEQLTHLKYADTEHIQFGNENDVLSNSQFLKNATVLTDINWFIESFVEMLDFLNHLSSRNEEIKEITLTVCQPIIKDQLSLILNCDSAMLQSHEEEPLFDLFYSSRTLFATSGIGLAKAKGFFVQTGATLKWRAGGGFEIKIPIEKSIL
ncbi:MAG: hypothetical protein KUG78_07425 [Kangiellaceae bacterium]|nr:hypothetical protein [Kangiellaceae bacterium]